MLSLPGSPTFLPTPSYVRMRTTVKHHSCDYPTEFAFRDHQTGVTIQPLIPLTGCHINSPTNCKAKSTTSPIVKAKTFTVESPASNVPSPATQVQVHGVGHSSPRRVGIAREGAARTSPDGHLA
uniref:Uncharacterized protein n=1 Tax=Timema monikensis TaxID=170555 RepID=A0A7R9HU41_9NEOP|nr:unnamed protein product [Timema monikensis]